MKRRLKNILMILLILTLYAVIAEASDPLPVTIKPVSVVPVMKQFKIPYVPVENLTISSLTAQQSVALKNFKQTLPGIAALKSYCNLATYQTSVKNQLPRGSCASFAFLGAIEAYYKRHYNLELDLSEEYFIHIVHSTQPTCNPDLLHENISSWCGASCLTTPMTSGEVYMALNGIAIPEEKYAPYFGDGSTYPDHSQADLDKIVSDSGLVCDSCSESASTAIPLLSQKAVDNYEYDPRYIPLEARKNARYGATKVQLLSVADTQDTAFLEQCLWGGHEVDIFLDLNRLDIGDGNFFSNGTPVSKHPDGNPIAVWPKDGVNEGHIGHTMLLIGYDKTRQLFLLKNSWGSYLPYFWVPYNYVKNCSTGGVIVLDVRDPNLGPSPEAMWIGKWNMDHDGWLGELVIRRTRSRAQSNTGDIYTETTLGTPARLGTYYSQDGTAHAVTGYISDSVGYKIKLFIDFDNPEGAPQAESTPITLKGQEFDLEMFASPSNSTTFGNYAAGTTVWRNYMFGALISRPSAPIRIKHIPGTFSLDDWKKSFMLFYSGGSTAYFKITDIASSESGAYYSVTDTYNGTVGHHCGIDKKQTNRLFFFGAFQPALFYHTHETGIASGLGVFGISLPSSLIVKKPTLTVLPYLNSMAIFSITCDTEGAVIHYTTDGSEPTENSPIYTEPLVLPRDSVIKTKTFIDDLPASETVTGTYNWAGVCEEGDIGELDIEGRKGIIGDKVKIPVKVQVAGKKIFSLGFEVVYDPSVLNYTGYERGNLTADFDMFEVNPLNPGRILTGGFSNKGTDANGYLVWLNFEVVGGRENECYPLLLKNVNDDLSSLCRTDGCFCLNKACNGDLNGDGAITPSDALAAFKCYLGSGPCSDCSDVNRDGGVTPLDALCIFKKYLGQSSCLDD
ncbi:MAG: chitobiase/beta-hexosaminidase C-terminal domain-containing protein [bacterium]|nr:chitobiase/beta-hexosaminidase C-terminal domain-containing protein [bacterium]